MKDALDHSRWTHGGLTPGGDLPDPSVLDLSVNINPYGPDPELSRFLRLQSFDQYPDPQQKVLRAGLAVMRDCLPENILVGNGCNELFWATARAFLSSGTRWISIEPNYSEFAKAAHATGAQEIDCVATAAHATGAQKIDCVAAAADEFRWSIETLRALIEQHKPVLVITSNPCSPTGFMQDPQALRRIARDYPRVIFAIDQSFLSLSRHWRTDLQVEWPDNVLRFHSLTKDFAIAGLRLGYVEGHPALLQSMQRQIPTWSVNSLAQAAGFWITQNYERLSHSRQSLLEDHERLEDGLRSRSIPFVPSSTIFTMVRPPEAHTLINALWQRHRILVRSCASYGLPDWLRIAARPQGVMQTFWNALDKELPCKH